MVELQKKLKESGINLSDEVVKNTIKALGLTQKACTESQEAFDKLLTKLKETSKATLAIRDSASLDTPNFSDTSQEVDKETNSFNHTLARRNAEQLVGGILTVGELTKVEFVQQLEEARPQIEQQQKEVLSLYMGALGSIYNWSN